ncbi:MAG: MFS transporter [Candidatus Ancaeobacter aquaticus]|nr:MFS transporter [Candidatus Ancaeobacter aquaticus]
MDRIQQDKALRYSIIDGGLSSVMDAIAGGIFLTGFALKVLHAEPHQIGILASLPMFANLTQIIGSYIIEKSGHRKMFCFINMFLGRLIWLLVAMLPFAIFAPLADWRIFVLVIIIGFSNVFQALSGVAWLTWMSAVVPANKRGTFFGKRNMVTSACGVVVALVGGKFITLWTNHYGQDSPYGYVILFAVGVLFGLAASLFLVRIPDVEPTQEHDKKKFDVSIMFQPFKDRNFLILTLYVSAWTFAVQFAGPFYTVFMMQDLNISLSAIAVFTTLSTLVTVFMMKIWGPISDKLGNKPVMIVSGWFLVLTPFIWLFALPKMYIIPIIVAFTITSAFTAGATLTQNNILIKLSPEQGRSIYFGLFASVVGIIGGVAPVIGGYLASILGNFSFTLGAYQVTNLHMIFIISAFLQMITIFFILKVKEPEAAAPYTVIMQLKTDLNPQTGIATAARFAFVNAQKGHNVLNQIDRVTDNIAKSSESMISKVISKPIRKIKEYLESDE